MNLLKMDMLSILDETPDRFFTPYNITAPIKKSIGDTIVEITWYMQQRYRIAILINLYYLGELLNITTNPQQIWNDYIRDHPLSNYRRYHRAAVQTYEIFQNNKDQIYQTKFLSMHYIAGMTNEDYHNNFLPYVKDYSSENFAF